MSKEQPLELRLSRRAILKLSAGAMLALGCWPGSARSESTGQGNFRFVVVNDTHCQSPECGEYLHKLALRMKQEQPQFVLHAGDLTDTAGKEWFGTLTEAFRSLGCPWYPVIGNHDYTSQTSRDTYTAAFPDKLNFAFEEHGWQFLGLDTSDGLLYERTTIQPATFAWLEENLRRLDPGKPTVVHTHFPLGDGVKFRPRNADALLERLLEFNLQAVFCGHFHGFTEKMVESTPVTTNRCCGLKSKNFDETPEKGFFVCDTDAGRLSRRFVEFLP